MLGGGSAYNGVIRSTPQTLGVFVLSSAPPHWVDIAWTIIQDQRLTFKNLI